MSEQAVIDSREFSRSGQELRRTLPVSGLARLQDCLYDDAGNIEFVIRGGRDEEMRLVLRLQIDGPLHLRCQRCLGRLDYPLHLTNTLRLVEKGEKLDETLIDPEDDDCVEASDELDVLALVEDEILLSLPFSPRHEEACCGILPQGPGWDAAKSGAFAKLAGLKKA